MSNAQVWLQRGGLALWTVWICGCEASRTQPPPHAARSTAEATQWELDPPKSAAGAIDSPPAIPSGAGPLFAHYCTACHGPGGLGDGQYYSDSLPARPANLTDPKTMTLLSDDQIAAVINGGSAAVGKSPLCPPWGRVFSKEQVAELVSYVRALSATPAAK